MHGTRMRKQILMTKRRTMVNDSHESLDHQLPGKRQLMQFAGRRIRMPDRPLLQHLMLMRMTSEAVRMWMQTGSKIAPSQHLLPSQWVTE
jgi:hypothetical protein